MQTDDLIEWATDQGWQSNLIYPYFADLGLSGTLRPDQRPDMLRLFDDLDTGRFDHCSIACYQENRLFRDETHIYYNQLIDKMLQHDVVLVVISPRLYIYNVRDEYDKERLREKLKEAAEFIPRHVKGWLLPARERAAWEYGEWAGIGDLNIGYIVDLDENSPTYKKRIPYSAHAEIMHRDLFEAFAEVGGEIGLLYRRIAISPVIFPFFEPWVDRRIVNKFNKWSTCSIGYILQHGTTIRSLLTNPVYIGYQTVNGVIRRDKQGNMITSHDPIIDRELFDFAFYRLSNYDLDGTPLAGREVKRYFYRGEEAEYGLLKFRIRWSNGPVHTEARGQYDEDTPLDKPRYIIAPQVFKLGSKNSLSLPCEEVDALIVNRLMEHVRELSNRQEAIDAYESQAREIRERRKKRIHQVDQSLLDTEAGQMKLAIALGKVKGDNDSDKDAQQINQRMQELILEQMKNLERERILLIKEKKRLEEEAENDIGSFEEELKDLEKQWSEYTFGKRRSLINFVVREVVVDVMSTHWVRVRASWLHEGWGTEEMYYSRPRGKQPDWTAEEDAIIQEHYATATKAHLMTLLPDRAWRSIQMRGWLSGRKRKLGSPAKEEKTVVVQNAERIVVVGRDLSYSDIVFLHSIDMPLSSLHIEWSKLPVSTSRPHV